MANRRKKKRSKGKGRVVGFYKDHGKTKPITKSTAQITQKKLIKGGKQFKGVKVFKVTSITKRDLNNFYGQDKDYAALPFAKAKFLEENTKIGSAFDWKEEEKLEHYLQKSPLRLKYPYVYNARSKGEDSFLMLWSKRRIPNGEAMTKKTEKAGLAKTKAQMGLK